MDSSCFVSIPITSTPIPRYIAPRAIQAKPHSIPLYTNTRTRSRLFMKTTSYTPSKAPQLRDLLDPTASTVYDTSQSKVDLIQLCQQSYYAKNPNPSIPYKATILVWLRHYGCTLCKQLLRDIQQQVEPTAEQNGVNIIAIGSGYPEQAANLAEELNWKHLIVSDPLRTTYKSLRFKQGPLNTFNLDGLKAVFKSMGQGNSQSWTTIPTDPFMLGGLLVVDSKGRVILNHVDDFAGDHCDLKMVLDVVKSPMTVQ
eukprot:CAMPEP_0184699008 /NCGR_PEP_ID=MMETSP0313-20130426/5424_1 /TAXON_ID=2792 /ORGANISM="Porphyridium aerugineum, Strain SAG 1380-2" /LENGTH=254 /DNA_ID=CAMNT_0027158025 /DNA_START=81 /DNA_END=845 /DNA_ORIENTATION=+